LVPRLFPLAPDLLATVMLKCLNAYITDPYQEGLCWRRGFLPRLCRLPAPPIRLGFVDALVSALYCALHTPRHLGHLAMRTPILPRHCALSAPRLLAKTLAVEANDAKTFSSAHVRVQVKTRSRTFQGIDLDVLQTESSSSTTPFTFCELSAIVSKTFKPHYPQYPYPPIAATVFPR
jgi:hypothetical protein